MFPVRIGINPLSKCYSRDFELPFPPFCGMKLCVWVADTSFEAEIDFDDITLQESDKDGRLGQFSKPLLWMKTDDLPKAACKELDAQLATDNRWERQ